MALYVSTAALAKVLGLKTETVRKWCVAGRFPSAVTIQVGPTEIEQHQQRRTDRGRWLIPLEDIEAMLSRFYAGEAVPAGVSRALRQGALPPPTVRMKASTIPMPSAIQPIIQPAPSLPPSPTPPSLPHPTSDESPPNPTVAKPKGV